MPIIVYRNLIGEKNYQGAFGVCRKTDYTLASVSISRWVIAYRHHLKPWPDSRPIQNDGLCLPRDGQRLALPSPLVMATWRCHLIHPDCPLATPTSQYTHSHLRFSRRSKCGQRLYALALSEISMTSQHMIPAWLLWERYDTRGCSSAQRLIQPEAI